MEEVDSRVAEIDHRREIARSTTRLRSGYRRFLYFIHNLIDSKFLLLKEAVTRGAHGRRQEAQGSQCEDEN